MAHDLDRPVHLYVKTHRVTGLKYFGRTVDDPYTYRGSGAYWVRHIGAYGNDVTTTVLGTFTDRADLRAAARDFSRENEVATSLSWANLLPEDGDVDGDGWAPSQDHTARIAALDAAVRRRMGREAAGTAQVRANGGPSPKTTAEDKDSRTFFVTLAVLAIASGIYYQSGSTPGDGYADDAEYMHFVLGALAIPMTPIGWIPAGIVSWIVGKMSDS
ncbi:hypothetical protein [Demequina rhizosphaerae]|uniref:hypothetical protein n=1 Tax=Demequina rhizosphaerae TaxID=1638985 RepID=UPI00078301EE|nr:hypothetical protein [Demequina rhizosphaerae]